MLAKLLEDKNQFLISVKDTGIGIDNQEIMQIFDRFYQAGNSAKRPGEGTGIGLSLTKELVQLMNGKIEAESTVGEGTEFRIWLPIKSDELRVMDDEYPVRKVQDLKFKLKPEFPPENDLSLITHHSSLNNAYTNSLFPANFRVLLQYELEGMGRVLCRQFL